MISATFSQLISTINTDLSEIVKIYTLSTMSPVLTLKAVKVGKYVRMWLTSTNTAVLTNAMIITANDYYIPAELRPSATTGYIGEGNYLYNNNPYRCFLNVLNTGQVAIANDWAHNMTQPMASIDYIVD